jgi:hypothetical protein
VLACADLPTPPFDPLRLPAHIRASDWGPPPYLLGLQLGGVEVVQHPLLQVALVVADDATACAGDDVRGIVPLSPPTACDIPAPPPGDPPAVALAHPPIDGTMIVGLPSTTRHVLMMIEPAGTVGGRQRWVPTSCGDRRVAAQVPSMTFLLSQYR